MDFETPFEITVFQEKELSKEELAVKRLLNNEDDEDAPLSLDDMEEGPLMLFSIDHIGHIRIDGKSLGVITTGGITYITTIGYEALRATIMKAMGFETYNTVNIECL